MGLLAQFDTASQQLLRRFFCKVALFVGFAAACSMPNTNRLLLVGALLQTQCFVAGTLSITIAILLRQRFDAATLTRWDEAVAFAGIGMFGHITTGVVQAFT